MIDIQSIADLELLRESVDLECKLAAGRDGRGALPEDFWPTYSALESTGSRGTVYHLPGEAIPTPDEVFGAATRISIPSSPNLSASSSNLTENRDVDGCLITAQLALPVIDNLNALSARLRDRLESLTSEPRSKGKVDHSMMVEVILKLCEGRFVMLRSLAELVNRKPETLRNQYLSKLVRERKLTLAFPKTPTHERQAYTTTGALSS